MPCHVEMWATLDDEGV